MDIAAPTGTPVRAAACGTVSLAGQQSGYGNIVCITHTSQFSTCYAHLSRFAVSSGTRVQQGQVIGYVGCTGSCTGPHLHFETRVGGTARDPSGYLGGASIPGATASQTSAASATTASKGGTTTAAGTRSTATRAGTSSTASQDALAQGSTTGTAIGPTTATAAPGTADYTPAQPTASGTVTAQPTATAAVPAATTVTGAPDRDGDRRDRDGTVPTAPA